MILIQPSEVQKPETGQKTGPRTTVKILCANEPVCQKKFACMKIFSIGPPKVQIPETGQKTGYLSGKFFSAKVEEFNNKFDSALKYVIKTIYIPNIRFVFTESQEQRSSC